MISEAIGHNTPAPEIFHAAAAATDASLPGAWVIGDSPHADIGGATGIGAHSVWVSGSRPSTETAYRPTHTTDDAASAVNYVTDVAR
ncbi:HAD hydrolase-like protein [Streptomyces regalis]|uniref:HAD family hydrolase n=1 Tax=Streptomyces regalis TaxID=68262 RepID=A0A117MRR2_9ACTN|nr:HAD hydrolase-like protein [Streptomyces regalis]KUL32141.1 hypothetical protein ADL12_23370 [Streptomyces regalis]